MDNLSNVFDFELIIVEKVILEELASKLEKPEPNKITPQIKQMLQVPVYWRYERIISFNIRSKCFSKGDDLLASYCKTFNPMSFRKNSENWETCPRNGTVFFTVHLYVIQSFR